MHYIQANVASNNTHSLLIPMEIIKWQVDNAYLGNVKNTSLDQQWSPEPFNKIVNPIRVWMLN
jgi:hypothetical protein